VRYMALAALVGNHREDRCQEGIQSKWAEGNASVCDTEQQKWRRRGLSVWEQRGGLAQMKHAPAKGGSGVRVTAAAT
jgi:hypothetical protein